MDDVHRFSKMGLKPSGIRAINSQAKTLEKTRKVFHLELGQPYFDPSNFIKPAIETALSEGLNNKLFAYIPNKGDDASRATLSQWLTAHYPNDIDPDNEVIFTTGCSEALVAIYGALLDNHSEVLVPTPAWPHYLEAAKLFQAKAVPVPLCSQNGFQLTLDQLDATYTEKTKLLVINNPNNPTGVCYSLDFQTELLAWARQKNIVVLFDEIYSTYSYDDTFTSVLNHPGLLDDNAIYMNGFSKSLGVPGLRVGYLLAKKPLCDEINKIHQYLTVSTSSLSLKIVANAIKLPELNNYLSQQCCDHQQRNQLVHEALQQSSLKLSKAAGAFYFFIEYPEEFGPSKEVCSKILQTHGVALCPGDIFGDEFKHHFRLCFSTSQEDLMEALGHIKNFFEAN